MESCTPGVLSRRLKPSHKHWRSVLDTYLLMEVGLWRRQDRVEEVKQSRVGKNEAAKRAWGGQNRVDMRCGEGGLDQSKFSSHHLR